MSSSLAQHGSLHRAKNAPRIITYHAPEEEYTSEKKERNKKQEKKERRARLEVREVHLPFRSRNGSHCQMAHSKKKKTNINETRKKKKQKKK